MKKLLILVCAGLPMACVGTAYAQDAGMYNNSYISGSVGWAFMGSTDFSGSGNSGGFEDSTNFSVAAGRRITNDTRAELEFSYRDSDIDNTVAYRGEVESYSFMVNGYYDMPTEMTFRPYIMGGIGTVLQDADIDIQSTGMRLADDEDWTLAWQAGLGINLELMDNTELYAGYRYQGATDAEVDLVDIDYDSHEILAGFRFYFK